jgi:hypothetical protein
MCERLALCPDDVLHKSTLMLSVYRDVVWMTARRADEMKEELCSYTHGHKLDAALAYLMAFAPTERQRDFEAKVLGLFETKWLVDLIDAALLRVYEYPGYGKLYVEILSKSYMTVFKYSEIDLLEILRLERSIFYERKREAVMLLGIALWGYAIPELKGVFASTGAAADRPEKAGLSMDLASCPDKIPTNFRRSSDVIPTISGQSADETPTVHML